MKILNWLNRFTHRNSAETAGSSSARASRNDFASEPIDLSVIALKDGVSPKNAEWERLTKQLIADENRNSWSPYRWTRYKMASLLESEDRLDEALSTYLEVCYWDLNIPLIENKKWEEQAAGGGYTPDQLWKLVEGPKAKKGSWRGVPSLNGRVLKSTNQIMKEMNLSEDAIREKFMDINNGVAKTMALPRSPEECWPDFQKELLAFQDHSTRRNRKK